MRLCRSNEPNDGNWVLEFQIVVARYFSKYHPAVAAADILADPNAFVAAV